MQFIYVFAAVLVAVAAQHQDMEQEVYVSYPDWYIGHRERRDVTFDHKTDNGRVFGTLGQNDNGLFGRGGYEHQFFNDNRGNLQGQVHGTRVLGPYGDSSHLGGGLKWSNPNAAASLDVSKMIHGPTSYQAAAGGRWPVGKNGDFSLQGTYGKVSGMRPEYGGIGNFNYRW
ncbi:gloverin-like [Epargyreus clarus]|uniref:gloverin-like n=1 Tax=Epargyreus clarus TaxID=520877 RepID=UPI003C2F618D